MNSKRNDIIGKFSLRQNLNIVFLGIFAAIFDVITLGIVGSLLSGNEDTISKINAIMARSILIVDEYYFNIILITFTVVILLISGALRFAFFSKTVRQAHRRCNEVNRELMKIILSVRTDQLDERRKENCLKILTNSTNLLIYNRFIPLQSLIFQIVALILISLYCFTLFPLVALMVFPVIILLYIALWAVNKKKMNKISDSINSKLSNTTNSIISALKGVRYIQLRNLNSSVVDEYDRNDRELKRNSADAQVINGAPKYFIETFIYVSIVVSGIAALVYPEVLQLKDIIIIGIVGLKAVPNVQGIYASSVIMKTVDDVATDISNTVEFLSNFQKDYGSCSNQVIDPTTVINTIKVNSFSLDRGDFRLASDGVSFRRGVLNCILGPSGAGKSTFVSMLCGLSDLSNNITLSIDTNSENFSPIRDEWREKIELLEQVPYFRSGSVQENMFGIAVHDHDLDLLLRLKILDNIDNIDDFLISKIDNLSGGELQRLGIYRSVMRGAEVLILDEPTSQLDAKHREIVISILKGLKKTIVIAISHDQKFISKSDLLIRIDSGRIR